MLATLQQQIKKRIENKHISIYALEKKAGLKASAVQNILQGKSRRPGADTLQAIAQVLDCTVSDLIGEALPSTTHKSSYDSLDYKLYIEILEVLNSECKKKKIDFNKMQILQIADEVYNYCVTGGLKEIDQHFIQWLISRYKLSTK